MKSNAKNNKTPYDELSICALLLCAGQGVRTGLGYNKMLYYSGKKTILELTLDRVQASHVKSTLLVAAPEDIPTIAKLTAIYKNVSIVPGGSTRSESVRKGLNEIGHCDIVVIHDGARPYVTPDLINKSIESAIESGSGIVAVPTVDTIKEIRNNDVVRTLSRAGLFNVQTPQTFRYDDIAKAYEAVEGNYNDDSEVYERAGFIPKIVIGDYKNVKITTAEDLYKIGPARNKIGVGFDVHQLVKGRKLVLGGIRIHHDKGLKGHSDGDALTHAIMDALLSAAGLPDIGVLFPDTDPKFKDVNSIRLLESVYNSITVRGFRISNVSAVVMAEKPRLTPFIVDIRQNLAAHLKIGLEQVDVSATTTEQLGIIGNEKGIAASATCLLTY